MQHQSTHAYQGHSRLRFSWSLIWAMFIFLCFLNVSVCGDVIAQDTKQDEYADKRIEYVKSRDSITVEGKRLIIYGPVASGAKIVNRCQAAGKSDVRGQSTHIKADSGDLYLYGQGASVKINGTTFTSKKTAPIDKCALVIHGTVYDHVILQSDGAVTLHRNAGKGLVIDAGTNVEGMKIGGDAKIKAGNRITMNWIGERANLQAGNSVTAQYIGYRSIVRAGNSIHVECAAGGFYRAGNRIAVDFASDTLEVSAGNRAEIKSQGANSCE